MHVNSNPPHSFDHDEVLRLANGEVFGPVAPKLPLPPMLMVSRITEVRADGGTHGKGYVEAELDIQPDLWFFQCHFKNDPVMPGCLGLDAMWQLTGFFLAWSRRQGKGRALGVKQVKFSGQVLPENKLVTYQINTRRVIDRKLVLAVSDGRMLVDGQQIYTAEEMRVGLFTE